MNKFFCKFEQKIVNNGEASTFWTVNKFSVHTFSHQIWMTHHIQSLPPMSKKPANWRSQPTNTRRSSHFSLSIWISHFSWQQYVLFPPTSTMAPTTTPNTTSAVPSRPTYKLFQGGLPVPDHMWDRLQSSHPKGCFAASVYMLSRLGKAGEDVHGLLASRFLYHIWYDIWYWRYCDISVKQIFKQDWKNCLAISPLRVSYMISYILCITLLTSTYYLSLQQGEFSKDSNGNPLKAIGGWNDHAITRSFNSALMCTDLFLAKQAWWHSGLWRISRKKAANVYAMRVID